SHSRGGLVGDTLARFCNSNENDRGFNSDEIKYLKDEGRIEEVTMIGQIKKELQNKKIRIEKFVRVACPAGGTVLASKRLDHFLNISFNLIGYGTGLAANPAYTAFRNLLAAAIDTKNDSNVLPGLEAMNPESPFIKVLNSPSTDVVVSDPLTVISGNCKVKPNLKALLIIASKLFYRQDNDLVVNTSSMYRGTKRSGTIQYYFDENSSVDHFHYFKNNTTRKAILSILQATDDRLLKDFKPWTESAAASQQRNVILNLEGGQEFTNQVTGTKPIAVLLPGIMGSNLTKNGKLVWIDYWKFLAGELTSLNIKSNGIIASTLIKTSYKKLVDFLMPEYDVVTFPFDWRLQLDKSAVDFKNKIEELLAYKQPIKIIGHSMGGVLVRDFIVSHPATWLKLNQSKDFKLIFLGAPLGGSYRIPAVLFGQDAIIDKLAKIDIFHNKKDLLKTFSGMPGILSLLPLTADDGNDFAKLATWKKMAIPYDDWPLPANEDLEEFKNYRNKRKEFEEADFSNMVYIAGKDKATPCGYRVDDIPDVGKELVFLSTAEGDQSVTWESGIPKKLIANDTVYYVNVTHGALANEPSIFKGIAEILSAGSTNLLSKKRPVVRAVEKVFRAPQQETIDISPEGVERTVLGLDTQEKPERVTGTEIKVSISNGDLHYASYPVMAGHFFGDGILNAEKAIDYYLGNALTATNKLAIYPGAIGTSDIFISSKQDFPGAIIVGLGAPGTLTAYQLTRTIEQATVRYLLDLNGQSLATKLQGKGPAGISSLIIGCGYGGLSIENSLRAILQGIQNANNKIKKDFDELAVCIQYVEFIEQFEDTALNCFHSLNRIRMDEDISLNIVLEEKNIKTLLGSKKQLQNESPSYWWKRLKVNLAKKKTTAAGVRCIEFSLSTGGAREEQRRLYSTTLIVDELIEEISTNNQWTPKLARTIFELLIPNDFKEQLKAQSNLNWIVEKDTASYPWELLQDATTDAKPLCVSAGMIRQLVTEDYRLKINAVTKDNALVIADPDLKGSVNQLPGAMEEGTAVLETFINNQFTVTKSLNESAPQIIEKLFSDDYKIIHLAGHGIFNKESPENSGMLIGDHVYLSTREFCQMSTVPELVFVNCCFLGKTDGQAEELFQGRYKLAANIGTQLIENGVKAVVAAGWAVDDAAALRFTKQFYKEMFDGENFGNAILKARKCIYEEYPESNTWVLTSATEIRFINSAKTNRHTSLTNLNL
ncbi:MAG: CHAT domain-containing protein, partial [Flavisolibacter sp.]